MSKGTRVYGVSDDLIVAQGECEAETGGERFVVTAADATIVTFEFSEPGRESIWCATVVHQGPLFAGLEKCVGPDAHIASDIVHFHPGLAWVALAKTVATAA